MHFIVVGLDATIYLLEEMDNCLGPKLTCFIKHYHFWLQKKGDGELKFTIYNILYVYYVFPFVGFDTWITGLTLLTLTNSNTGFFSLTLLFRVQKRMLGDF